MTSFYNVKTQNII